MNHMQLIKMAHALGYTAGITEAGLCKGYIMMWARAACSGKLKEFEARMQVLDTYKDDPQTLASIINDIKTRIKERGSAFSSDKYYLPVPAFFESIALYLHPHLHTEIFDEFVHPHDEDTITDLLDSDQPEMAIATCHRQVKAYTEQQLEEHLIEMAKKLAGKAGCVIEFNSIRHSVGVQVNEHGNFVLMDINFDTSDGTNVETLELSSKELAAHLMQKALYFDKKDEQLGLLTTVYARRDLKDEVSSHFQEVPFELTNNIDVLRFAIVINAPGMASAISNQDGIDVHGFDNLLLATAINYSNYEVVEALLTHKNFNLEHVNFLDLAGQLAHMSSSKIQSMLDLFKKVGIAPEILNHPVFTALSHCQETDNFQLVKDLELVTPYTSKLIVRRLIADGYDFMKGTEGASPLHHVFTDEYIETVKAFIDAGYDLNNRFYGNSPLDCSMESPAIIQLLLDHGADPADGASRGVSVLDRVCTVNPYPQESIKTLIRHQSVELNINQIVSDSAVYIAIKTIDDPELKLLFATKALDTYFKTVSNETGLGIFFSKEEKANAARVLLNNIQNGAPIDPKFENALNDGRLGQIRSLLPPPDLTGKYRTILKMHREEPVDDNQMVKAVKL